MTETDDIFKSIQKLRAVVEAAERWREAGRYGAALHSRWLLDDLAAAVDVLHHQMHETREAAEARKRERTRDYCLHRADLIEALDRAQERAKQEMQDPVTQFGAAYAFDTLGLLANALRAQSAPEPESVARLREGGPLMPEGWGGAQSPLEGCGFKLDVQLTPIPSHCEACGKPLRLENLYVDDGCPCNSPRGVNFEPRPCDVCKTDDCVKPGHRLAELFPGVVR